MTYINIKKAISKFIFLFFTIFYIFFPSQSSFSQKSLSIYEKSEKISGKDFKNPYQLIYMPVIPSSEKVYINNNLLLRENDYIIDYKLGQINIKADFSQEDIIRIDYNIIPVTIKQIYQNQLIKPKENESILEDSAKKEPSQIQEKTLPTASLPTSSDLNFSGTKTLSLSMEKNRGISINQPTRLNINGKITEDISINAILSDEDLPLQPEGTTEEIEDLDRVLIEIKGKHLSATLGDYESSFDDKEFVLSPKMLAGAQAKGDFDIGGFTLLGAVSKGQSASMTIQGKEGQNEYRISLEGKFIIMVAGSEEIWLNGEKMRREIDYVIRDYGDPIVEFTKKHLITGKDVIVIDYEYIDEESNYGQKLYGVRGKIGNQSTMLLEKSYLPFGINALIGASYAIESDDKDNPLISLSNNDIESLKKNELDPDGDGKILPVPKSSSIIGFDGKLSFNENTFLVGELALNKHDSNTFSKLDRIEESKAWKLDGSSNGDHFRLNFSLRGLEPNFTPIGATTSSRSRATYQKNYDQIGFGNIQAIKQVSSPEEKDYNLDLWIEPLKYIELKGNLGRNSSEYKGPEPLRIVNNYWSRGIIIGLPNLPRINTRFQEVSEKQNNMAKSIKTRELLELNHRLWQKINLKMTNEEIQSLKLDSKDNNDIKRSEQRFIMNLPSFWKVSLSSEFSYERDYANSEKDNNINIDDKWQKTSSARTATLNLSSKPTSWLDFSGYFGHRKLSAFDNTSTLKDSLSDNTTNVSDVNMNLKFLQINYKIDRKLSTEKEEQYVNYVMVLVDGQEVKRYLLPGEGSYVRIDEYTYREDLEKGEYIRLIRNVSDKPVTSLAFQSVFSIRPRLSFGRRQKDSTKEEAFKSYLIRSLSMFELGTRIIEEQDRTSGKFYILRELQTEKTIYGSKRYWHRSQITPHRLLSVSLDWETNTSLNKRLNSQIRRLEANRWKTKLESPFIDRFIIGGEFGKDDTLEKINSIPANKSGVGIAISDISELQRFRAIYLGYSPTKLISRVEIKGGYETEWNDNILSDDLPVLTKTLSVRTEANMSFMGKGSSMIRYEIARGTSSGDLPFARYDFHNGISHKVNFEINYRVKWFTDLLLRTRYRGEFSEDDKPDHRFEMEATADF